MLSYRIYQKIVADIVHSLNPGAEVKEGQWVTGPDGRRDLDVLIRGVHNGRTITIVIECKDWRKRVGIETIDALESKRRDVAADVAFVCSNSGFTKDARRKAGRVGIGLVTILQHGDRRIRSVIEFDLYVAHINISNNRQYTLHDVRPARMPEDWNFDGVTIHGRLFWKLFEGELLLHILQNLEFKSVVMRVKFRDPVPMVFKGATYYFTGVDVRAEFNVVWRVQKAKLDTSRGVYHYIHQKLEMVLPGNLMFKDVDVHAGRRVKLSQDEVKALKKGQFGVLLAMVHGGHVSDQEDAALLAQLGVRIEGVETA